MKVTRIVIRNFKGVAELATSLEHTHIIEGVNGSGKTTFVDAITWVLYGVDSTGAKDFPLKPKHLEGSGVIVSVEITLESQEGETVLRKELHEQLDREGNLKGNTFRYLINDLPVKAKEWEDYLTSLRPQMWQLRTDPLAFGRLHWKERRQILATLVDFAAIEAEAKAKHGVKGDLEALKIKLRAEIGKLEESIKQYQPRIDEAGIVNVEPVEWQKEDETHLQQLKEGLEAITQRRAELSAKLAELRESDLARQKEEAKVFEASIAEIRKREEEHRNQLRMVNTQLNELQRLQAKKLSEGDRVEEELNRLRQRYTSLMNGKVVCPIANVACQTAGVLEKLTGDVENQMRKIEQEGKAKKAELTQLLKDYELVTAQIEELKARKEELEAVTFEIPIRPPFVHNPEILQLEQALAAMGFDDTEIRKLELKKAAALTYETARKKAAERVEQLRNEWRLQASELQARIKDLQVVEACEQEIAEVVESKVNTLFEGVCRFQMYTRFINGNLSPDCQLYVEGKPWEALNHGKQVMTGLAIINRLNSLLGDEPWPVLIDNAESVNGLRNYMTNYQIIATFVTE